MEKKDEKQNEKNEKRILGPDSVCGCKILITVGRYFMKRPKSRGAQFQYKIVHCSHYRIMVGPPISGHITAIRSSELGAQLILPHQKTKKKKESPYLQACPNALSCGCVTVVCLLSDVKKRRFPAFNAATMKKRRAAQ